MANSTHELDAVDRELLRVVQQDARATLNDVSAAINLSVSATRARLRALEERGVITGYTARVDPFSCGYALRALVRMKVHGALYDKVTAFLADEPQVLRCLRVTGESCYVMEVVAIDMTDLARITSHLAQIGSITTDLVYEVVTEAPVSPAANTQPRRSVNW